MSDGVPGSGKAKGAMLTEDEARVRILAAVEPLPSRMLSLRDALGCFATREGRASQSLPAFDNSAMDGYAVAFPANVSTLPPGTKLVVHGEQAAGPDRGLRAEPGIAVRIFTGAPVPAGAVAVVMQEDVERDGGEIVLREEVTAGEFIRRAGGDLARGQRLFDPGSRLTPQRLGLLASQGLAEIEVGGMPQVAVLPTGDELRPGGQTLGPGEIYESNGVMLASLAASLGAEVSQLAAARDDRADLDAKLSVALGQSDVVIVAGGVSVGERDFVKERLAAAGVELDLWRVRIQPGKPFLYGRASNQRAHVFGLPGNPVSAFVTFLLFVRPALLRLAGAADPELPLWTVPATAGEQLDHRGDRPHYLRGTLDRAGQFFPSGKQESHALFALSQSNALVRIEPATRLAVGAPVMAHVWSV